MPKTVFSSLIDEGTSKIVPRFQITERNANRFCPYDQQETQSFAPPGTGPWAGALTSTQPARPRAHGLSKQDSDAGPCVLQTPGDVCQSPKMLPLILGEMEVQPPPSPNTFSLPVCIPL